MPSRKKRKDQTEHEAKLARIENPLQRAALERALSNGDEVPEFAWHPMPRDLDWKSLGAEAGIQEFGPWEDLEPSRSNRPNTEFGRDGESAKAYEDLLRALEEAGVSDEHPFIESHGNCEFLRSAENVIPLCHWGYFNPYGPTLVFLFLVRDQQRGLDLIFYQSLNPFSQDDVVFGALPNQTKRAKDCVAKAVKQLFERNGDNAHQLFGGLPSYVLPAGVTEFATDDCADAFSKIVCQFSSVTVVSETAKIEEFSGDPWDEFIHGRGHYTEGSRGRSAEKPASKTQFRKWWDLATAPDYRRAHVRYMPSTWYASINHLPGIPDIASGALEFEVPRASLRKFLGITQDGQNH